MKTRIKKLISVKSMPVLALALLVLLGTALAASRDPVSGSGNVFGFVGSATFTVGDETFEGSVAVIPLEEPVVSADGVFYFPAVQHTFEFDDESTLITVGEEVAEPKNDKPGEYTLNGYMDITEATMNLEGISGRLRVHGTITDLFVGEASFEIHGVISR